MNIDNHKQIAANKNSLAYLNVTIWMDIVDLLVECNYREDKGWTEDEEDNLEKINNKVDLIMDRIKEFIKD